MMREEIKKRIDKNILYMYENWIRDVSFPVQPLAILYRMKNCRCISYEKLAEVSGKRVQEIAASLGSYDGCTTYDKGRSRYLVAVNYAGRSRTRIRWTTAHELGHIASGHFEELASCGKPYASPSELDYMEEEADYFAASFLAPLAAIRILKPKSAANIRDWFDLSQTAAEYRWSEHLKTREPTAMDDHFHIFRPHSVILDGKSMTIRIPKFVPSDEEMAEM